MTPPSAVHLDTLRRRLGICHREASSVRPGDPAALQDYRQAMQAEADALRWAIELAEKQQPTVAQKRPLPDFYYSEE